MLKCDRKFMVLGTAIYIQARDLVEAAIAQRRLSADTLEDKAYLSHVGFILDNLDKN